MIKKVLDEYGIIYEAEKILPESLKLDFLSALAELEEHDAHVHKKFPKTRLHKVSGVKAAIYRADIDKISGWRIHLQYKNGILYLKDIIKGQNHDEVIKTIQSKSVRYD